MLNHKGTQIIETARLTLRPFTMDDADAMFRNWASDDEVTKYITWPAHENMEVTKAVLTDWTAAYESPDRYNWAIVLKENGPEPIGNISVVRVREKTRTATMGYCMSRAHWGKGIMPEALGAVLDFLFDQVGFNRIEADHDTNNPNSGAVMRKCGMTYEGVRRQGGWDNQGICDICVYAILASDR